MATVTGYIKTQDDTLLAGKDAAGAATAAQNYAVQRGNHTGTQTADTITDGTTNKAYTATERTKLAGVATGATANRTDAATDAAISAAVAGVINGAPGALDTLKELADALGDDANYAATITTALAGKATPAQITAAIAALNLGTASTHAATDFETAGTAAAAVAAQAASDSATYVAQQADSTAADLWAANYDRAGTVTTANTWEVVEAPSVNGTVQPSRLAVIDTAPGSGAALPSGRALHVTLNPFSATNPGTDTPADGDVFTDANNYQANRAEVYDRTPAGGFSTPAAQWPDPVGSTRWYGFSVLIPAGFTFATDNTKWLSLTQWKGLNGNQAPIFLGLRQGHFNIGGSRTDAGLIPNSGDLSAAVAGTWARFEVGQHYSTDPTVGWVEVWQDGVQVLARTHVATMDTYGGTGDAYADPIYFKQGIYRGGAWATTAEVYFGPVRIGTTRTAVTGEIAETAGSARNRLASVSVSDATTGSKGIVQLAGDLAGTAAAPTVPGLAAKAPIDSPAFTGTPTVPTAGAGTNTTQAASTAFVAAATAALVNAAPGTLDTLKELADALGDDPNYAATVTALLGAKAPLASPALTGNPTAPTATAGDSSTSIATTAFVGANAVNLRDAASQQLGADGVSLASPWQQFTARSFRAPSKVVSRFPSGHGWTGGADDTVSPLFTDRTYKITTNGSGGNAYLSSPTLTAVDMSASSIRLIFKVDNAARLANVNINAKTDGSNIWQGSVPCNPISGEWCVATVPRASFHSVVGTPNWASITALDVFVADNGGSAPLTFNLAAFELIPDLASTYPSGVFILEADDGYIGQKTYLAPVVGQRGIPVTYNPIASRFVGGSPASGMTAADLRVFQDLYGWQMSCHAYNQTVHDANPATAATLEQDFQRQKHWLHANGLHAGADHFAECPGTGSPVSAGTTMDVIRKSFRSARVNAGYGETAVPADSLRLRSILFSGQTVSQLQTNINNVAGAGGALIFTVHDVVSGSTNGTSNGLPAIAANNLATVLDYAAGKGMVFRTRADYLDGR